MPASFKRQLEMAGQFEAAAEIKLKPTLLSGLDFYYTAFFDLSTTRSTGMGIGLISWLNVRQYAMLHELDTMSTYFLHRAVKAMDAIYVEHCNNEHKRNQRR